MNEDSFRDPTHSCDRLLLALPFEILAMSHFSQIRSLKMDKISPEVNWLINRSCSGYCEACGPRKGRRPCWEYSKDEKKRWEVASKGGGHEGSLWEGEVLQHDEKEPVEKRL